MKFRLKNILTEKPRINCNFNAMKRLSKVFQPIISTPNYSDIKISEITCKSQKLLVEWGLVRGTGPGLFALMPLARRSLQKLEALVRTCLEDEGAQEMSLPALSSAALWEASGRLDGAPAELMQLTDRHGKALLLAPTHEEAIADLLSDVGPLSYKQFPIILYQISNKYRDEHRPKHGLLRAREFSMLDAYGAHSTKACAEDTYTKISRAYTRLFHELRLPVHRVPAPCGEMGGTISHEWQVCAAAGEDLLSVCEACNTALLTAPDAGNTCRACGVRVQLKNSIEVGHTFILGTKYSEALKAHFVPSQGAAEPIIMSCYGIGITRLLAAGLEALSSETCLRWPEGIAPFNTIIIGPKAGSREAKVAPPLLAAAHDAVLTAGDVVLDDRDHLTIGKRQVMAQRMGYPNVVILGRGVLDSPPKVEVHCSDAAPRVVTIKELQGMASKPTNNHTIMI